MVFPRELRGGGSSGIGKLGKLVGAVVRDIGVCHPKLRSPGLVDEVRENPFFQFRPAKTQHCFARVPENCKKPKDENWT
jgi:hypothetical protein